MSISARSVRVAIIGPHSVGCTSLVDQMFFEEMNADRGMYDGLQTSVTIEGSFIICTFHEYDVTDNPETDKPMWEWLMRHCNAFIMVFAVDSRTSLDELKEIHQEIVRSKATSDLPIVVCGNKIDVENREVSTEEGNEFARSIHARYIETSALKMHNVFELFDEPAKAAAEWFTRHREINEGQREAPKKKGKKKGLRCVVA